MQVNPIRQRRPESPLGDGETRTRPMDGSVMRVKNVSNGIMGGDVAGDSTSGRSCAGRRDHPSQRERTAPGDRGPIGATKRRNGRWSKGGHGDGDVKDTPKEMTPPTVPNAAGQGGEIRARWAWSEPSVWTERMLTALENGVKGGVWPTNAGPTHTLRNVGCCLSLRPTHTLVRLGRAHDRESRMREIRQSGSVGGGRGFNRGSLPQSQNRAPLRRGGACPARNESRG